MLDEWKIVSGSRSPVLGAKTVADYSTPFTSKPATHLSTALKIYATIEFLAVAGAAYFASTIYHFVTFKSWQTHPKYIVAAFIIASLLLLISIGFHNYFEFRKQPRHIFLWRGIGAAALAFAIFITALFFTQSAEFYSRGSLVLQTIGVGVTVVAARAIFYSWLQTAIASNRINGRYVVLIGDVAECAKFAARMADSGIKVVGSLRLPARRDATGTIVTNRTLRRAVSQIRSFRADDVIILAGNEAMPSIFDFASSLATLPAGIHIVPVDALNIFASSQISELGNVQTIQVFRPPLSSFDLSVKRAFDVIFATIGLIALSPLFLIISIAIKLDSPGPVFFRNTRHGFNNDEIRVFKFRSMVTLEDGSAFTQAVENDPRVTRVGYIIRRTNIDELPQLFNVLRGEMSLVGPRPHATAHNALFNDLIAPFSRRHNVKPGITGWAQVNGYRGATNALEIMQQRIEHDLYYIDNWSFLFDIKIILMTLFSRSAYVNAY